MNSISRILSLLFLTLPSILSAQEQIAFLIEPQCENEVNDYFAMLNDIEGFDAKLISTPEQNYRATLKSIRLIGIIETSFDNLDLNNYAIGAIQNCATNKTTTFEVSNPQQMELLNFYLNQVIENSNNSPIFIEIQDGKITFHERE